MSIHPALFLTPLHRRRLVLLAATATLCLGLATCSRHPSEPVLFVGAAPNLKGELHARGGENAVSISPDGQIWLAYGEIAVADSILGPWRRLLHPTLEWPPLTILDWDVTSANRVSFFTADTAIATDMGYVPGDAPYSLLRTVDGGRTWDKVPYGIRQSAEAVFTMPDGNAWIGGLKDGALMHSNDYGATWDSMRPPFPSRVSSIYMADARDGVVGGLWNHLAATRDGGATWTQIPTPFDQGFRAPKDSAREHVLDAVALIGDRIVVTQGNRVYERRRDGTGWSPLRGDARLFAYDREGNRLYAVSEDRQVLRYDERGRPEPIGGGRLLRMPECFRARDGHVIAMDNEGMLYDVRADSIGFGFPLTDRPNRRVWKVRRQGHRLWGVTTHQIYRSDDLGKTWDRVGFMPTGIRSFLVRSDGQLVLWDGHARNRVFDPVHHTLRPIPNLRGYDVVDILPIGGRWIAFGGRQYETMGRVERSRTYYPGQFEGSRRNGFVLVSDDEGRHWDQVDEWEHGGVANLYVDPASWDMVLVSYLGGVRRLTATTHGYVGKDMILPSRETWNKAPYVERPTLVYFQTPTRGVIDGWIHRMGYRRYTTLDGGRTWTPSYYPRHAIDAIPTPAGYLVLQGSELQGGTEIDLLQGFRRRVIWAPKWPKWDPWDLDAYPYGHITDFGVDPDGRIIAVVGADSVVVVGTLPPAPKRSTRRARR